MSPTTQHSLDVYYAALFGIDVGDLWCDLTVRTHTVLGDYAGVYVAWRGDGVHLSVPPSWSARDVGALADLDVHELQDPDFWAGFAAARGLQRIGPATHTYLDVDPGPVDGVRVLDPVDLADLRSRMSAADWEESGFADDPPHAWGLERDGALVAASNLNSRAGAPRDVGVLVVEPHRGRGLAAVVGRQAASSAVAWHGYAHWGARDDNLASRAAARRLGFEPWCTQVAVRPGW